MREGTLPSLFRLGGGASREFRVSGRAYEREAGGGVSLRPPQTGAVRTAGSLGGGGGGSGQGRTGRKRRRLLGGVFEIVQRQQHAGDQLGDEGQDQHRRPGVAARLRLSGAAAPA